MLNQCLLCRRNVFDWPTVSTKQNFPCFVLEYRQTTYFSIASISRSVMSCGKSISDSLVKTGVTSLSNTFHVSKKAFFPFPDIEDVVSQPLNAWKNGRAYALSGPRLRATSCIGMNLSTILQLEV